MLKNKGFTLLEAIMFIIVLGIIIAIVLPRQIYQKRRIEQLERLTSTYRVVSSDNANQKMTIKSEGWGIQAGIISKSHVISKFNVMLWNGKTVEITTDYDGNIIELRDEIAKRLEK